MTRERYGDCWVCDDCYTAHHNGAHEHAGEWYAGESDTPCDSEPLAKLEGFDVADHTCADHYYGQADPVCHDVDSDDYGQHVEPCEWCHELGDENGIETFSSRPCQGCGSTLGGARYRLSLWTRAA